MSFLTFYQGRIVGVSQLFPLVFPITDQVEIHVKNMGDDQQERFNGSKNLLSDFLNQKPLETYHEVASLNIRNNNPVPVRLYIPDASFLTKASYFYHGFHHYANNEYGRYDITLPRPRATVYSRLASIDRYMGKIGFFVPVEKSAEFFFTDQFRNSQTNYTKTQEDHSNILWGDQNTPSILITLESDQEIDLPLSITIDQECLIDYKKSYVPGTEHLYEKEAIVPTAVVFEGGYPVIHQVLDNRDFESAKSSIVSTLNTSKESSLSKDDDKETQSDSMVSLHFGIYDSVEEIKKQNKDQLNKFRFYKNSCPKVQQGFVDLYLKQDKEAWFVSNWNKRKEVRFGKTNDKSLIDLEHRHIKNALETEYNRRKTGVTIHSYDDYYSGSIRP